MQYQLAQCNIAEFLLPQDHPANIDFVNNIDRVNATAESQPGFIWRFTGAGNDALDVRAFDNPDIVFNMSVWADLHSLAEFVYRNDDHKAIMRRRKEWFRKIEFHMVLWWVEADTRPTVEDAKVRLDLLRRNGPASAAFTFKQPYAASGSELLTAFKDKCA